MIRPMGKRVLVTPKAIKDKSDSGILVPEAALNPLYLEGIVEAVGSRVDLDIKKGDVIAFQKIYDELIEDKKILYLVEDVFIIAVVE